MKQETIKMRAPWLTALMAGAMLVSCSNDMQMPSGGADGSAEGKVTFNISLPSTEKVIYGGGTRALHDEAEYNVTTLDVYEYDVNTGFVAKHTFSAADGSIRPAGEGNITGEYTVTITEDLAEVGSLRRFYFVANNANGVTPATGTDYETGLRDEAADIALSSGSGSSVLCPEGGIAMSGLAVNTETNGSDITIKSGAMNNVHVDLTRIVGRVDLYSNADNLVITGARMEKAAEKGYLMADHSLTSTDMPGEIEMLDINANAGVAASGEACLPAANAGYSAEISTIQQYNDGNGTGVRKAFYMYERDNSEGDCTQIVVSYALADGTTGEAVVPFTKTDETTGEVSYVNIERNHLYKVVLGNGEDITPGSQVEVKIIDEPWNVVDLPVVVEKPEMENVVTIDADAPYNTLKKALHRAFPGKVNFESDGETLTAESQDWLYELTELKIVTENKAPMSDDDWTFLRNNIQGYIVSGEPLYSVDKEYETTLVYNTKGKLTKLDLSEISFLDNTVTAFQFLPMDLVGGEDWFYSPIKEIILPDNITKIESESLEFLQQLETLKLPNSITEIGDYVFFGCTSLKDLGLTKDRCEGLSLVGEGQVYFASLFSLEVLDLRYTSVNLRALDSVLLDFTAFDNMMYWYGVKNGFTSETSSEDIANAIKRDQKLREVHLPATWNIVNSNMITGWSKLELIDLYECVNLESFDFDFFVQESHLINESHIILPKNVTDMASFNNIDMKVSDNFDNSLYSNDNPYVLNFYMSDSLYEDLMSSQGDRNGLVEYARKVMFKKYSDLPDEWKVYAGL